MLLIGFIEFKLGNECALALYAIEFPLIYQGVDGPANGHARGIKLSAQFRFGWDYVPARILPAFNAGVDALNDLPKDRMVIVFHLSQPLDQISCLYKIITLYNCFLKLQEKDVEPLP